MAELYNGRYALADPSSGLTAISMECGEINIFGSCTKISTTKRDRYPDIDDAPVVVAVKNNVMEQLRTGLVIAAVLAGVAIAVAVTGGAALAPLACALGGAAIGTSAVAIGTAISDSQTGYNRSWGEYWERLITGCLTGYIAGASVYGLIAAIPAAATAAGVQASMMFETSAFTAIVVPDIMVVGGYGLAIAGGVYTANDIYSNSSGYNVILDKVFDNNVDAYEATGMVVDTLVESYTNLGESNQVLGNKGNYSSKESGEESSKKLENTGDNEDTGTGTTKGNNTKTTVDDNNTKAGTTKDDSAKSAIDNKDTEMTSGDTLSIEIKDKNSKQDVSETEVQGEQPIQNYSHSKENIEENKGENNKHSVNLDKSGENKTDKNTGEDRGKQEKSSDKGTSGEGIIIEQGNDGVFLDEPEAETSKNLKTGKNFKDHYIRHKGLLEEVTGKKYPKYKVSNNGQEFLNDLQDLIVEGELKYEGLGTIKPGFEAMEIYRGNGITLVIKTNGEFVTLLKSGEGMDKNIQFVK